MQSPAVYPEEKLILKERKHEFGDVFTYTFTPETTASYTIAGQYGHIRLSGMPKGVRAVREFSFASAPHERDIVFGVDAKSGSPYQKRLLELEIGSVVALFKIKSHMTWPCPTQDAVFIAGGVGVTPFRAMLSDRAERLLPVSVTLVHVSRAEYLYEKEMRNLADIYIPIHRSDVERELSRVVSRNPHAHYYVAGSPAFVDSMTGILSKCGISHFETDPFKGLEDV